MSGPWNDDLRPGPSFQWVGFIPSVPIRHVRARGRQAVGAGLAEESNVDGDELIAGIEDRPIAGGEVGPVNESGNEKAPGEQIPRGRPKSEEWTDNQ